jgi:hypothetical protein
MGNRLIVNDLLRKILALRNPEATDTVKSRARAWPQKMGFYARLLH